MLFVLCFEKLPFLIPNSTLKTQHLKLNYPPRFYLANILILLTLFTYG
jgi:hypothetical protein